MNLFIVLFAVNELVSGKLYSIPFKNPEKCSSVAVSGDKFDSFFNSMSMTCTPCSQSVAFQRRSGDGQLLTSC